MPIAVALTPARVLRAIRARVLDRIQPLNAYRGVYRSFAEAERAAPRTKPLGYDAALSEGWYLEKLRGVQLEDYPVVFWLREALRDSRSILEIGGHVGVAYYGFSSVLDYPEDLSWTIFDVPTIVEAGRRLAAERGRTDVHFVASLADAPPSDILIAAGALQYFETPTLAATIATLPKRPRHAIVNVTPVYEGPTFVTLQNIGTVYCPYRVFDRRELVSTMEELGYALVDAWQKPRPFRVPGHADKSFDAFSGFYFRTND